MAFALLNLARLAGGLSTIPRGGTRTDFGDIQLFDLAVSLKGLAAVRTSRSSFIGTSNQYHKLAKGNPKNPIPYCPLPPRIW